MNNTILSAAVLSLVIGGLLGYVVGSSMRAGMPNDRMVDAMKDMHDHGHDMHSSMEAMTKHLEGKTGETFDKAFLEEMIVHHEGAVAMAQMVLTSSNREELKTMANSIIAAQTTEINQMKAWLTEWFKE